jgi:hypothetical protein
MCVGFELKDRDRREGSDKLRLRRGWGILVGRGSDELRSHGCHGIQLGREETEKASTRCVGEGVAAVFINSACPATTSLPSLFNLRVCDHVYQQYQA